MNSLISDIRTAMRMLRAQPGFTVVVALTLALGIGANTAIFSLVNAVLLRPLPFKEADRLVMLWSSNLKLGIERNEVSLNNYLDWQRNLQVFDEVAAYGPWGFDITGEADAETVPTVVVTPNLFKTLGIEAAYGRTFLPEESSPGRDKVVLISHALWQRRYGGDPGLVGRTLTLDGEKYTVVGIMPAYFHFPNYEVNFWAPLNLTPDESSGRDRWLNIIGRLKSGMTIAQAQSEIGVVAQRLEQQAPGTDKDWGAELIPLHHLVVRGVRTAVLLLFAAAGLVLLITCVNVANLMLARIETRRKEIAVRGALGATRRQLIRFLLSESVLLSLIGGIVGLMLAYLAIGLLTPFIPGGPGPGPDDLSLLQFNRINPDFRVFGFAFLLSLLTAALFGLLPAYRAATIDPNDSLKEGNRNVGGSSRSRLRESLIIGEVALTLMMLIGAGLLVRSFVHLLQEHPGFRSENLLTFRISPAAKYRRASERLAFYRQVIDRIRHLPGVQALGATTTLPFSGVDLNTTFRIEGREENASAEQPAGLFHSITPGYLTTMGIPLLRGRAFTEQDNEESPRVVLINETMARHYWPNQDPLGQRLRMRFGGDKTFEVVGIVGDTRQMGLDLDVNPEAFVPFSQRPWSFMTFAVRTVGNPLNRVNEIKGQLQAVDRDVPIYGIATMEQRLSDSIAKRRFSMLLAGSFAFAALSLAAIGVYGVMSYTISQRTYEIGIRMALGADKRSIFKLIIGHGLILILIGAAGGLVGSLVLSRFISAMLYRVSAVDYATIGATLVLLTITGLSACYLPARRATKVDPMTAIRYE